jgi:hypothetical protein
MRVEHPWWLVRNLWSVDKTNRVSREEGMGAKRGLYLGFVLYLMDLRILVGDPFWTNIKHDAVRNQKVQNRPDSLIDC